MITAHGGALGTGRNTRLYFDNIGVYCADAIEVDIYRKDGLLYLSHLPAPLGYRKRVTLKEAFELVKRTGHKINCDLKMRGLVGDVIKLAEEVGVTDNLIFTGAVKLSDSAQLTAGQAWLNKIEGLPYTAANVPAIKKVLEETGNPHFAGLNINKRYGTDEFLAACRDNGVELSVFTLDDYRRLSRFIGWNVANVTTNLPTVAADIRRKTLTSGGAR